MISLFSLCAAKSTTTSAINSVSTVRFACTIANLDIAALTFSETRFVQMSLSSTSHKQRREERDMPTKGTGTAPFFNSFKYFSVYTLNKKGKEN